MAKIQNTNDTKCEDVEPQECSSIVGGDAKWYGPFGRLLSSFFTKLNMFLPYNPVIAHLSIFSKEMKTYVHTKTHTQIFIAIFFVIAQTWK